MDEPQRDYAAQEPRAELGTSGRVVLGVFAAAAAYFLWTEHQAHVIQYLPWAILALCPLMHVFMHRGHGGHGSQDTGSAGRSSFWVLSAAWPVLFRAQREGRLATTGAYARVRHPQYLGFIAIMTGFLSQWPTLVTLVMFPILVFMYVRLAHHEEEEARAEFGPAYDVYARETPRWIPRRTRTRKAAGAV